MRTKGVYLPEPAVQKNRSVYRPSLNSITEMQRRFVEEYLVDLNGTQAAIRAGFLSTKASSASTAMLKFGPVREEIARRMASRSARVGLNADRVLFELGKLVVGDTRTVFNEDGTLKKPSEMDEYAAPMIAGVKTRRVIEMGVDPETGKPTTTPVEMQEIKLVDRLGALTLAMRHLGMMNDKLDINVTSLADRMLAARLRLGSAMPGFTGVTIDDASGVDQEVLATQLIEYEQSLPAVELHDPELEVQMDHDGGREGAQGADPQGEVGYDVERKSQDLHQNTEFNTGRVREAVDGELDGGLSWDDVF